jgi:hypothetical protein
MLTELKTFKPGRESTAVKSLAVNSWAIVCLIASLLASLIASLMPHGLPP